MVALRSLPLERLGQLQALLALLACPLVAVARHPWPLALAATLGFGLLMLAQRGYYTPNGSFGSANAVTAVRLAGVLMLGAAGYGAPVGVVVALAIFLMVLDGVDGFLARRAGTASPFGAHFDVEVDALLVLVLGAVLWQRERLGVWALWPGSLRYLYVLVRAIVPGREAPQRTIFGRLAFGGVIAGLLLPFLDPGSIGTLAAVAGTLLVTASFAHSFYGSYVRSAR
jgi:phosphatidylglycerophosphate synthase